MTTTDKVTDCEFQLYLTCELFYQEFMDQETLHQVYEDDGEL